MLSLFVFVNLNVTVAISFVCLFADFVFCLFLRAGYIRVVYVPSTVVCELVFIQGFFRSYLAGEVKCNSWANLGLNVY